MDDRTKGGENNSPSRSDRDREKAAPDTMPGNPMPPKK